MRTLALPGLAARLTAWFEIVAWGAASVTVTHGEFPGQVKVDGREMVTVAIVPGRMNEAFMPRRSILPWYALALLSGGSALTAIPVVGVFTLMVHW